MSWARQRSRSTMSWTDVRCCSAPTRAANWTQPFGGDGSHSRSTGWRRPPAPAGGWGMGQDIERDTFDELEYTRFAQRLEENLSALQDLLDRSGFGVGPTTIGAELELFLIDDAGRPLPRNQAVRVASADPRVTVELDRFNLELNASPVRL